MKKNFMMRLASFLLVAVLISTSAISGTYAKYVTQDSGDDEARVAKWGVEVIVSGTLFGEHYYDKDDATYPNKISAVAKDSVDSLNGDNVVAPGTENLEGMSFKVTGIPEVSGEITADANGQEIFLGTGHWGVLVVAPGVNEASKIDDYYIASGTNYVKATAYVAGTTYYEMHDYVNVANTYYPIIWNGNNSVRLADFASSLETAMIASFDPGDDLNNATNRTLQLKWVWPFTSGHDGEDTILGNLFDGNNDGIVVVSQDNVTYAAPEAATTAEAGKYCVNISFDATITVTQTD